MGYSASSTGVVGTWIPTVTGFTSSPTVTASRYVVVGKLCYVTFTMSVATSNATTLTITLPFTPTSNAVQVYHCKVTDNGSAQTAPGQLVISAGNITMDVYKTLAAGAFTGSGNKSTNFTMSYEIA